MINPIRVFLIEDNELLIDSLVLNAKLQKNQDILIFPIRIDEKGALELTSSKGYDVALVDLDINTDENKATQDRVAGLRVIEKLATQPSVSKVLAFSAGLVDPEFIIRVLRAGAAGYIWKEHTGLDQLFDSIRDVYRGRKVFPESIRQYVLDYKSEEIQLSERELEIWRLIADGYTNSEIAKRMNINVSSVKRHAYDLYLKIQVTNRTQAVRMWVERQHRGL